MGPRKLHWASKETYNFLEWCPLKSTASKWMTFGLMLVTVLLITHVKKQRNRMCQNEINAFKSQQVQFQNHRNCSLSTAQTFGHFNSYSFKFNSGIRVHNSYSKPIVNMITYPTIEFEWIAIEVFESLRGGKGAVSVILKLDLLWFEGIYLIFGTYDFFVFWRG